MSAQSTSTTTTSPPQASPYRDPAAGDVIIRTSDGIEFHIHRRRISDISSVFADKFSLPTYTSTAANYEKKQKPVIDVSESSKVWEKLLPLCYLANEPSFSLEDIRLLIEAGRKYDIPGVTTRMRALLFGQHFLEHHPFVVYALACVGGFEYVARAAARRTLSLPVYPEHAEEFSCITGEALYRLFEYRKRCGLAASAVTYTRSGSIYPVQWMDTSVWYGMHTCSGAACGASVAAYGLSGYQVQFRKSWYQYLQGLTEDLKLQPDERLAHAPSRIEPVVLSTLDCKTCAAKIYSNSTAVADSLAKKIKEAIDNVSSHIRVVRRRHSY